MPDIIAIDGPAGAGKSTIARKLARKLGYKYLDTGAMYRAVTLTVLNKGINLNNKDEIIKIAKMIDLEFLSPDKDGFSHILLDGLDVAEEIRKPEVNKNVSEVAKIQGVRESMVNLQRKMGQDGEIVMEGRDITSRVFPDADLKLFITASLEERAKRRFKEMKTENPELTLEDVKLDIARRDKIDSERDVSPLVKTKDSILIDTTDLDIEEVLEHILVDIIKKKG